jgi:hypothetical protein
MQQAKFSPPASILPSGSYKSLGKISLMVPLSPLSVLTGFPEKSMDAKAYCRPVPERI